VVHSPRKGEGKKGGGAGRRVSGCLSKPSREGGGGGKGWKKKWEGRGKEKEGGKDVLTLSLPSSVFGREGEGRSPEGKKKRKGEKKGKGRGELLSLLFLRAREEKKGEKGREGKERGMGELFSALLMSF